MRLPEIEVSKLTLVSLMRLLFALLCFGLTLSASGQAAPPEESSTTADAGVYEPILVPIYFNGEGAGGSIWETELWISNENDFYVETEPGWYDSPSCRLGAPCPIGIPANTTYEPPVEYFFAYRGRAGLLFNAPAEALDKLWFSLRVRDRKNDALSAGTDIPVVRGSEFRSGRSVLLNIPTDERFRLTLRVYKRTAAPETVTVRMKSHADGSVVAEEDLLLYSAFPESDGELPLSPAFGEIANLTKRFPVLREQSHFRLDIEAEHPSSGLWAFVSITNDETGQVTIISPQ